MRTKTTQYRPQTLRRKHSHTHTNTHTQCRINTQTPDNKPRSRDRSHQQRGLQISAHVPPPRLSSAFYRRPDGPLRIPCLACRRGLEHCPVTGGAMKDHTIDAVGVKAFPLDRGKRGSSDVAHGSLPRGSQGATLGNTIVRRRGVAGYDLQQRISYPEGYSPRIPAMPDGEVQWFSTTRLHFTRTIPAGSHLSCVCDTKLEGRGVYLC